MAAIPAQVPKQLWNDPESWDCAICFDPMSENVCTVNRCRHSFHRDCIEPWIEEKGECPTCRTSHIGKVLLTDNSEFSREYQRYQKDPSNYKLLSFDQLMPVQLKGGSWQREISFEESRNYARECRAGNFSFEEVADSTMELCEKVDEELGKVRNDQAKIGEGFAEIRNDQAKIGEGFAEIRNDQAKIGEGFAEIRNDQAKVGEEFAEIRNGFAEMNRKLDDYEKMLEEKKEKRRLQREKIRELCSYTCEILLRIGKFVYKWSPLILSGILAALVHREKNRESTWSFRKKGMRD